MTTFLKCVCVRFIECVWEIFGLWDRVVVIILRIYSSGLNLKLEAGSFTVFPLINQINFEDAFVQSKVSKWLCTSLAGLNILYKAMIILYFHDTRPMSKQQGNSSVHRSEFEKNSTLKFGHDYTCRMLGLLITNYERMSTWSDGRSIIILLGVTHASFTVFRQITFSLASLLPTLGYSVSCFDLKHCRRFRQMFTQGEGYCYILETMLLSFHDCLIRF